MNELLNELDRLVKGKKEMGWTGSGNACFLALHLDDKPYFSASGTEDNIIHELKTFIEDIKNKSLTKPL